MTAPPLPNLYLVGFMGTGKSTVGRRVAPRLGFRFLDSDREIERTAGRTVARIFAEEGEAAFRARERCFIVSGHPRTGCVVACGGGLVVPRGMIARLRRRGVVICLQAAPATVLRRTVRGPHRPLLGTGGRGARVRELLAAREKIYRAVGPGVRTDGRPVREVVAQVLRIYWRKAKIWEPA